MHYDLRIVEASDLPSLARIYKASINHLGAQSYSAAQVAAWASYADDVEAFQKWITRATTFVAMDDRHSIVGFGGLEDSSRVSSLFVSPEAMRKGVGSALLQRLISESQTRGALLVTTEASEFSKPLFEKFGFSVKRLERIEFKSVAFTRYAMEYAPRRS